MTRLNFRMAAASWVLGVLALSGTVSTEVGAQAPTVDPEAVELLRRTTEYIGGLQQFSVQGQSTFEDLLDSGHRVDYVRSASLAVSRPNKLRAERHGLRLDQVFYYDGETLTLHNPHDEVYATEPAPGTIDEMLHFARDSLGVTGPFADLVYSNAFSLLMYEVTLAKVIGKVMIGGVQCHHLLFSRPGVDFQMWVAASGPPLLLKYAITDTSTPTLLGYVWDLKWNVDPAVSDASFTFVAPEGAKPITFLRAEPR